MSNYQRDYYLRNREQKVAAAAARRAFKSDEIRAADRAAYAANPEPKRRRSSAYREVRGDSARSAVRRWFESNPEKVTAGRAKDKAARLGATPTWADQELILVFYKEAKRLTGETRVEHQVDHIVPIKGRNVCGLHVETNLQVLTKQDNLKKGNRHEP